MKEASTALAAKQDFHKIVILFASEKAVMAALAHAAKEEVGHFGNAVKLALKIASTE